MLFHPLGYFKDIFISKLNIPGAMSGISCGIIVSIIELRRCFRLAKKGVFVSAISKRSRKILFLLIFPLAIILGVLFLYSLKIFFPGLNIYGACTTGLLFFGLSSGIGAIGIYALERHYGNKFYIGRRSG